MANETVRNCYCLFRHGESESSRAGVLSCLADALTTNGLTEQGVAQVKESARLLRARYSQTPVVIASDFLRTLQSAAILSEVWGIAPLTEPRLRERSCPHLHGRPTSEFRDTVWTADGRGENFEDCEPLHAVVERMTGVVRDAEDRWRDKLVILVTHCDPARILHVAWTGRPLAKHFEGESLATAEWIVAPEPSRPFCLEYLWQSAS